MQMQHLHVVNSALMMVAEHPLYYPNLVNSVFGNEKRNKIQNKKLMSLDGFIERYGSELGTKKHLDFCNRNKGNWSLDRQIEMHGELCGKQNYSKIKENVKKAQSLDGFIEKHGLVDGTKLWKSRMVKMWYSSSGESFKERFGDDYQKIMRLQKDHASIESFIIRYGENIGAIKYKEFCNKVGITLEKMISKKRSLKWKSITYRIKKTWA
jgi:hypothetical protein